MNNTDKTKEELRRLRPDLTEDTITETILIHNGMRCCGLMSSTGSLLAGLIKEKGSE